MWHHISQALLQLGQGHVISSDQQDVRRSNSITFKPRQMRTQPYLNSKSQVLIFSQYGSLHFLSIQLGLCFNWSLRPYQGIKHFVDYYSSCEQNLEFWNWCSMLQRVYIDNRKTSNWIYIDWKEITPNFFLLHPCSLNLGFFFAAFWLFDWLPLSSLRFYRFQINEFRLKESDANDPDLFHLWSKFTVLHSHNSYRFTLKLHPNNVGVPQV